MTKSPTGAQLRCMLHIRAHGVSGATGARHVLHRCVESGWVRVVGKPPHCRSKLTAAGIRELARHENRA
jgi:hypothetical protein